MPVLGFSGALYLELHGPPECPHFLLLAFVCAAVLLPFSLYLCDGPHAVRVGDIYIYKKRMKVIAQRIRKCASRF